ncbi:MAG: peptidoglycan DD-metalloendopeptidase family protein [Lachnospiraceae bacterium]|nr:peptidoglycan DD-metalloendopeptidase family protein [Lachnospiraceae bacterium]
MKRKRGTRFVVLLVVSSLLAAYMPLFVHGASLTNDKIKQSEEEKKNAESERAALANNLTDIKSLLAGLETTKNDLETYIQELDSDLGEIDNKINNINRLISDKEFEIQTTEKELEEARATEKTQYEMMKRRIKFVYERGEASPAQMLLSSKSFVDFLNKAEFVQRMSAYDKRLLDLYIDAKDRVASKEMELLDEKSMLEEANNALQNEQEAVETLMADKEKEITEYENDIEGKEAAIAEYEAMIAEQDRIIKDIENAILAEKKRLLEENKKPIVYDGGQFKWPAPSYTRISDDYGYRIHPTLGTEQFHNGVDMAAPSGSPILAAYDGEVIAASYSATMGNYIMIDHGDGLVTVYMHASSLGVSQGTMVTKGEQIGCVGSTGRSTGPHLHFSVRLNGSYVSPWNYLS